MSSLSPLNEAAKEMPFGIINSNSGFVVSEQFAIIQQNSFSLQRFEAGDILSPSSKKKVAIFPAEIRPSNKELRDAFSNPDASSFAVYELTPPKGKVINRISQVALLLSVFYLFLGLFAGVFSQIEANRASTLRGGMDYSMEQVEEMKNVISKFETFRMTEDEDEEQTKKFFDAVAEARKNSK